MSTAAERADTSYREVLRNRDFRLLFAGQAVSTVGDEIFPIAATISVINASGGGNAKGAVIAVGLVQGARFLAIVSFALIGGVWADRLPRRLVMISSDIVAALAILTLALIPGTPHVWVIAVCVFVVGAAEAFFRPAETAILPSLIPDRQLTVANGLISVSYRTAAVVGPGLGGLFIVGVGVRSAYVLDVIALTVSALTLLRLREPIREPASRTASVRHEIAEGWRELRTQRWAVTTIFAGAAFLMLVVSPENVLLPIIGRREFGGDAVYAWSLALFSLGGVVGAVLAIRIRTTHPGRVGWLLGLLFAPVLVALAFPRSAALILALYFVAGAGWEPFNIYWQSAIQREFPADKLARISSLDWMLSFGLMPLGLALTGPLAALVGTQAVMLGAAVVCVVICLGVQLVPGVAEFRNPTPKRP